MPGSINSQDQRDKEKLKQQYTHTYKKKKKQTWTKFSESQGYIQEIKSKIFLISLFIY